MTLNVVLNMKLFWALLLSNLACLLGKDPNQTVPFFERLENVKICELDPVVLSFPHSDLSINTENCNSTKNSSVFNEGNERPVVSFPKAKDGATYVVLLMDMNTTNCSAGKFYIHWMSTNLPGNDLSQGRTTFIGTESFEYVTIFSKRAFGTHQYICLAYQQNYNYHYFEYPWRRCFHPNDWAPTTTLREVVYGPTGGVQFNINF